jgi:CRP-like cAMP-binding protein
MLMFNLSQVFTDALHGCCYFDTLSKNLISILAAQNVLSNLKLRIANQRALRDRILMYLHSLAPDKDGYLLIPFTQTALVEFLGVNRSTLSRKLGKMQNDGLLIVRDRRMKLLNTTH